jgi:hypothetical protein
MFVAARQQFDITTVSYLLPRRRIVSSNTLVMFCFRNPAFFSYYGFSNVVEHLLNFFHVTEASSDFNGNVS